MFSTIIPEEKEEEKKNIKSAPKISEKMTEDITSSFSSQEIQERIFRMVDVSWAGLVNKPKLIQEFLEEDGIYISYEEVKGYLYSYHNS
jgi:hypothetical protein